MLSVKLVLRGAHGHVTGSRPWVCAENNIEGLMANIVGKKHSCCFFKFFFNKIKDVCLSNLMETDGTSLVELKETKTDI